MARLHDPTVLHVPWPADVYSQRNSTIRSATSVRSFTQRKPFLPRYPKSVIRGRNALPSVSALQLLLVLSRIPRAAQLVRLRPFRQNLGSGKAACEVEQLSNSFGLLRRQLLWAAILGTGAELASCRRRRSGKCQRPRPIIRTSRKTASPAPPAPCFGRRELARWSKAISARAVGANSSICPIDQLCQPFKCLSRKATASDHSSKAGCSR